MNTQIRPNVFETNSSSTHSICISEKDLDGLMDTSLTPDKNDYLSISGGIFGWEVKAYNDALTKSNYIATMLYEMQQLLMKYLQSYAVSRSDYHNLCKWAYDNYSRCYDNFTTSIKEQTGLKDVYISEENIKEAYIDHQSAERIRHFEWLLDKEKIRQFIFNKESWLLTGSYNTDKNYTVEDGKAVLSSWGSYDDEDE